MRRLVFIANAVLFGLVAALIFPLFSVDGEQNLLLLGIVVVLAAVLGVLLTPWVVIRPVRWFVWQVTNVPARDLLVTLIGAFVGLVFAALLYLPLSALPEPVRGYAPTIAAIVLATGMAAVFWSQQHAAAGFLPRWLRGGPPRPAADHRVILDTSAIIDGRIADIADTGFLRGTVVVPRFVLDELQHVADSPDPLRRARGRRGLEILNRMQRDRKVETEIVDRHYADVGDVDAKLVQLARELGAPLVTNDFNLNRVAELQGVTVLNVNSLANAVKTVVLPGEEMALQIIQEGKEPGQGVGFLDDGTMVVVENGRRYMNRAIEVVVTRVLTTAAGRMIFATPKPGMEAPAAERQAS